MIRTLGATCVLVLATACGERKAIEVPPPDPAAARRIVCGNAAAAEFVCRLVPAERLAGLPEQADDYVSLDLSQDGFEKVPRFPRYLTEPLLALHPDLVVTHAWQSADTTSLLRSQGIGVIVLKSATSYGDVRDTLVDLGRRLGAEPRAQTIVHDLDARVAALRAGAGPRSLLRALVYTNDGSGGTTAGAHTTPDTFLELAGLRNAAAVAGLDGHVTIDFERLLVIDPDVLVVARLSRGDAGSPTRVVVEEAPALATLRARRLGRIVELSALQMAADSPSIVDAAEEVARQVDRMLHEAPR